jgi:hypothetical protein
MTAIPIWVESKDESVARVVLRYKAFGAQEWKAVDMTKVDNGWAGEIPCRDVGTITGVLRYYVTAYDENDKPLASHGSLKAPNKVRIRQGLGTPPPHLPGRPPPQRCYDPTDCPPGFPGCKSVATGDSSACMADDDCDDGMICGSEQKCEARPDRGKKNWISIGGLQDIVFLSNANICAPENQASGQFTCLRQSDGEPYLGTPLPQAEALRYGAATTRLFLGFDHFVSSHFSLGLRAGYVVKGLAPAFDNRGASIPLLLEGRIGYWFSDATVRPVLFLAGGYAPVDFKFNSFIDEDRDVPATQPNPDTQTVDIWTMRGPWFGGLGFGLMFATSAGTGFLLEVEGVGTYPTVSTVVRPSLSFMIGF